jgi:hypothetical protein
MGNSFETKANSSLVTNSSNELIVMDFINGINATSFASSYDVKLMIMDPTNTGKVDIKIISELIQPTYIRTISWAVLLYDKAPTNRQNFGVFSIENVPMGQ